MNLTDQTMKTLAHSLNFRQMRQEIISSNIANADTPGYKAKRLGFEDQLARAIDVDGKRNMATSGSRHLNIGQGGFDNLNPDIYEDPNGIVKQNKNTVNREREMTRMAENKILYDAAIQLLNRKIGLMKYALSGSQ